MENLSSIFEYEPQTGVLAWRGGRRGRGCVAGREAGTVKVDGRYRTVVVDGKRRYVHRIVWEMHNGPIPVGMCIDHVDGNGLNNKIENLRLTTLSLNQRNRAVGKNSTTGIPGVNCHCNGKGFSVHCANKYAGYSEDFFEACCLRKSAELQHGYHTNHGRN